MARFAVTHLLDEVSKNAEDYTKTDIIEADTDVDALKKAAMLQTKDDVQMQWINGLAGSFESVRLMLLAERFCFTGVKKISNDPVPFVIGAPNPGKNVMNLQKPEPLNERNEIPTHIVVRERDKLIGLFPIRMKCNLCGKEEDVTGDQPRSTADILKSKKSPFEVWGEGLKKFIEKHSKCDHFCFNLDAAQVKRITIKRRL